MLIIFEGIDNVGKSTQIRKLKNYFAKKDKVFLNHCSSNYSGISPEKHKELTSKEYLQVFKYSKFTDIICDRLHGGEYVYSPIYRQYSGDFVFDLELQEKINLKNDAYLIILVDEAKNVIERDDGKSHSVDLKDKENEIQKFKEFFVKSKIKNKLLINIYDKDIERVNKEIIDFIDNFKGKI